MYAVLAALVWFTMDAGKVLVLGKPVEYAVGSADCDWRVGVAHGFGPLGGEDSQGRGKTAFSFQLSAFSFGSGGLGRFGQRQRNGTES